MTQINTHPSTQQSQRDQRDQRNLAASPADGSPANPADGSPANPPARRTTATRVDVFGQLLREALRGDPLVASGRTTPGKPISESDT